MNGTTQELGELPQSYDAEVEGLSAAIRRETLVLACASQGADPNAAPLAAVQLRKLLDFTLEYAYRRPADLQRIFQRLASVVRMAEGWIAAGGSGSTLESIPRVLTETLAAGNRAIDASHRHLIGFDLDDLPLPGLLARGANLLGVVARRAQLDGIDATGATIDSLTASGASLRRGVFANAVLKGCDLSHSNLESSRWCGARVEGGTFANALLADANLDGATFVNCDFQGADLRLWESTGAEARPPETIHLIRCDLRNAVWDRRRLSRVSFVDCRSVLVSGEIHTRELLPGNKAAAHPRPRKG